MVQFSVATETRNRFTNSSATLQSKIELRFSFDRISFFFSFAQNESAAYHLHSIGAVNFFNSLRVDLTPELERYVDEVLENILSQRFVTSPVSNLSRSSSSTLISSRFRTVDRRLFVSASCQLLPSNAGNETANSTMFQLPLLNLSHQQQPPPTGFSTARNDASQLVSQTMSNQSGARGILKINAPSLSNLMTTFDSENTTSATVQWLTVFPTIHLTQSDRTVLANLENSILSRDDPTNIIGHCRFLSNVVFNDFPAELFLQRSFVLKVKFRFVSSSSFDFIDFNSQRLLALLNENHDELVQAALICLKDYALHLQRRIKILRDPSCFCPNLQLASSQCDANEFVHDEFNNTMNSARSVSSINSAMSNGYRNPSQW